MIPGVAEYINVSAETDLLLLLYDKVKKTANNTFFILFFI